MELELAEFVIYIFQAT